MSYHFLLDIALILISTKLFGLVTRRFQMPQVVGALLAGLLYQKIQRLPAAFVGEVVGTGILGAMLSYPVAVLLMGKTSALFAFVPSFMINTVAGSIVAVLVLCALERTHILRTLRAGLH